MNFIKNDRTYSKYYDEFIVLLGTGMRVSEFCGLTKTECGRRFIPMTNDVYNALQNILKNSRKQRKKLIIDGYSDFLLVDKNGSPKVALHIENEFR